MAWAAFSSRALRPTGSSRTTPVGSEGLGGAETACRVGWETATRVGCGSGSGASRSGGTRPVSPDTAGAGAAAGAAGRAGRFSSGSATRAGASCPSRNICTPSAWG